MSQLGYPIAISGSFSFPLQLLITPTLLRRFGCAKVYHICMFLWFLPFVILLEGWRTKLTWYGWAYGCLSCLL